MIDFMVETTWNAENLRPQWSHPFLLRNFSVNQELSLEHLQSFAYAYYLKFLPYFQNQAEGDLKGSVNIEFSHRLKRKLGTADLHDRIITLNQNYFSNTPHLLPYTMFHEIIHIWLYDCDIDPGHTKRFYKKMAEFSETGLPLDTKVHIHIRAIAEGGLMYRCPSCNYKWFTSKKLGKNTVCDSCDVPLNFIKR